MTAHAVLSASSSHRWLECTPSAQLEQQFPNTSSVFAEEGTHAHAWAEMLLRHHLSPVSPSKRKKEREELAKSEYHSTDLEEYVESYVSFIKGRLKKAQKNCPDAVALLEQRLDFSDWVPDGFGTGDFVIIADGVLEVIDLKYGKGVRIGSEDNTQMQLYALGAISLYSMLYDFDWVQMTIFQPRISSEPSTSGMAVKDLLDWAENYLSPRAFLADQGKGEFSPDEDVCRFCRAKGICRARATQIEAVIQEDFKDVAPELLTADEIAKALAEADKVISWFKDVQDYALKQALDGEKYEGFKLVEGRSNRAYTDKAAVAKVLLEAGFDEAFIYNREVLGVTAMEKALGKKIFTETLSDLIVKPPGKPALVEVSDKRPEYCPEESIIKDFE